MYRSRKIPASELVTELAASLANQTDSARLAQAVRISVTYLAQQVPGKSVELRVPPYAAAQLISGVNHRRGTPPNVVETDPITWLLIAGGKLALSQAVDAGRIVLSGTKADLIASYLPLVQL